MKEKFRLFFEKHRHLIVISLIVAVILAALTPLLIPLGLEVEENIDFPQITLLSPGARLHTIDASMMKSYSLVCSEHADRTAEEAVFSGASRIGETEGLETLVKLLKRAPEKRNKNADPGGQLCTVHLIYTDQGRNNLARDEERFTLHHAGGKYSLVGTTRNSERVCWYISEASAQAILAYLPCETQPGYENHRAYLCDARNVTAAELITWANGIRKEPVVLTPEQIEAVCRFLEAEFLHLTYEYSSRGRSSAPEGSGWHLNFATEDGATWQMKYESGVTCYLTLGLVPEGRTSPEKSARYHLEEENPFAALPELLEAVP